MPFPSEILRCFVQILRFELFIRKTENFMRITDTVWTYVIVVIVITDSKMSIKFYFCRHIGKTDTLKFKLKVSNLETYAVHTTWNSKTERLSKRFYPRLEMYRDRRRRDFSFCSFLSRSLL